ncbi:MAG: DUF4145 domain-containing protein [Ignavibacteriae bacterium]|nr:DUF4145 domain-containing protein [Ignavibacteriota bacterium]
MIPPYKAPTFGEARFNCPHCNAFAHQEWSNSFLQRPTGYQNIGGFMIVQCLSCGQFSFWYNNQLIYPDVSMTPLPNSDLREDIKVDYLEARSIVNKSPRGAAALLRLCIQKLCEQLGESGKDINTDIGNLVQKGLHSTIQKSLDIVRVIGNDAVHPGQIDLKDDIDTANKLFELVNLIAQVMITEPKAIDELYTALPESKRKAIEERDKQHQSQNNPCPTNSSVNH